MGVEYRLEVQRDVEAARLSSMLVDLGAIEGPSPGDMLEFRSQGNVTGLPDAFASPIEGGIYFCVNGGCGRGVFERLLMELSANFGHVTVQEY